jgi:hypothetical protein
MKTSPLFCLLRKVGAFTMTSPLNRRVTQFPGSNETGPVLSRYNVTEPPPGKLKRLRREKLPAKLPITVNPHPIPLSQTSKRLATAFCENASPWQKYKRLFSDEEAGPVVVAAHEHDLNLPAVAIKEREAAVGVDLKRLIKVQHGNVVHLLAAFYDTQLYLVYESTPVSLLDVQSCSYGPLKELEMASVCKEVRTCHLPSLHIC